MLREYTEDLVNQSALHASKRMLAVASPVKGTQKICKVLKTVDIDALS